MRRFTSLIIASIAILMCTALLGCGKTIIREVSVPAATTTHPYQKQLSRVMPALDLVKELRILEQKKDDFTDEIQDSDLDFGTKGQLMDQMKALVEKQSAIIKSMATENNELSTQQLVAQFRIMTFLIENFRSIVAEGLKAQEKREDRDRKSYERREERQEGEINRLQERNRSLVSRTADLDRQLASARQTHSRMRSTNNRLVRQLSELDQKLSQALHQALQENRDLLESLQDARSRREITGFSYVIYMQGFIVQHSWYDAELTGLVLDKIGEFRMGSQVMVRLIDQYGNKYVVPIPSSREGFFILRARKIGS